MQIDAKLLAEWGGTCGGPEWMRKAFPPNGVMKGETLRDLIEQCPNREWNVWFLEEVALRWPEHEEAAVDLLVEISEPGSTLPTIKRLEKSGYVDRLVKRMMASADAMLLRASVEHMPAGKLPLALAEAEKKLGSGMMASCAAAMPTDLQQKAESARERR